MSSPFINSESIFIFLSMRYLMKISLRISELGMLPSGSFSLSINLFLTSFRACLNFA